MSSTTAASRCGVGLELVGACPVCGDGGKGSRSNRFAVHLRKNAWLCRRCQRGGGVVDLVMHLDGVGFQEAVAVLAGGKRPSPAAQHTPIARPALDFTADEERKRQRVAVVGRSQPDRGDAPQSSI
jgi:hypothetical protein